MNILVQLGLAVETESGVEIVGKKTKPLTETEVERFKKHRSNFKELYYLKFQKDNLSIKQKPQIEYNDQGENPISNWFNTASQCEEDTTFLFGKSIKNAEGVVGNFFVPWNVKFICFTDQTKKVKKNNPTKKFKTEFDVIEIDDEDDAIEANDKGTLTTYSAFQEIQYS